MLIYDYHSKSLIGTNSAEPSRPKSKANNFYLTGFFSHYLSLANCGPSSWLLNINRYSGYYYYYCRLHIFRLFVLLARNTPGGPERKKGWRVGNEGGSVTRGFVLTIYAQTTNTDDTTFLNKQSFIYTITYLARIRDMNRLAKEIATIRRHHQYCGVHNTYCYTC